ncbi:MAG: 16S rRNA (guanine(966)-N(2))-methyltransferase RsmD [Anaerolineae bacterium]|nr:16S rRNA (guanine(966)-N(2))-methyltransferase RsmD [Anaerolineae bacterium]
MPIRVIAGKAKGRKLKTVPGDSTRPVMDRVKENLFNILGADVRGSRWLDLFGGTGSVGIEALSRDAAYCLFLDTSRAAIETIRDNLRTTGLEASADVRRISAFAFLDQPPAEGEGFEVIYIAPPQYKGMWQRALDMIDAQPGWLLPDGIAVVQIDPKEYLELSFQNLNLYDQRRYGKTMLCFYERPGS